jgi:ketosteroid isomerase-like protein
VTPEELADAVAALRTRVRTLEDAEAVRALKARYAELVDGRYAGGGPRPETELAPLADAIAALFTEDAVWDGGPGLGVQHGRAAIRERMARPTLLFSRHYFVNPRIEVAGDEARGRWELLAPCTLRDGRPAWMAGVEDDVYARVDGAWLHRRMHLTVHFVAPHERGWSLGRKR